MIKAIKWPVLAHRAVQLSKFDYDADLVNKAGFVISSKSPSPAFRWSDIYYTEP